MKRKVAEIARLATKKSKDLQSGLQPGSKSAFVIFPNCLFSDLSNFETHNYDSIFLVEEPMFFGHDKLRPYNINKIKLAWLRACMKSYFSVLQAKLGSQCIYVDYDEVQSYQFLSGYTVSLYDPVDYELETKLASFSIKYHKFESLLFLVPTTTIKDYFETKKGNKRIIQNHFYEWIKKELDVLTNVRSTDSENRQTLPKSHKLKWKTPSFNVGSDLKYYKEARDWVDSHHLFKDNIGDTSKLHLYPINEDGAKLQFTDFLENRAKEFGPYEDAIDKNEVVLFHSFISAPLNNGLLSPKWALDSIMKAKGHIPMNSLEGWVRQLTWREYQRSIYVCYFDDLRSANHFGHSNKLNWEVWYGRKSTNMEILDNELKKALSHGFAHHIPRLCIFLNMFNLLEVQLDDVVRWFSEVIAMDAYPWVNSFK